MADLKRRFRGIVENSWSHLVALVLVQLGYVYQFFYNIGFYTYRGLVRFIQKAKEIPQLRRTFNTLMGTLYYAGLQTFGFGFSMLRDTFYFSLNFTKGLLIKLLSGDFAGSRIFIKSKTLEASNNVTSLISDGSTLFKKSLIRMIRATSVYRALIKIFDEETMWAFLEGPTMTRTYKLVILTFTVISAIHLDYLTFNRFLIFGGIAFCISCILLVIRYKRRHSKSKSDDTKVSNVSKED